MANILYMINILRLSKRRRAYARYQENENEYPNNLMNPMERRKESTSAAVAGMFLVDIIPLLGFPIAFLLAQAKFRSKKLKLIAITAAFILLNITVTVFFYAASITLMHNSLTKAAEKQGFFDPTSADQEQSLSSDFPSAYQPDPPIDSPLLIDGSGEFVLGTDAGMSNNKPQNMPADVKMPETDKDGNTYIDSDNDGEFDSFIDKNGNVIPMDSMVDENGNRYVDYDRNGIYEAMIDRDGLIYYDLDGDGEYETNLGAE